VLGNGLGNAPIVAVALFALAAPARAVTLVTPAGEPVGGQWQQWADEAQQKVPTITGNLQFIVGPGCFDLACSQSPNSLAVEPDGDLTPLSSETDTWISPLGNQLTLDWELGHQFDWAWLTTATRQELATVWDSAAPWWDSEASLDRGTEDGLEATFADAYMYCATGAWEELNWPNQPALTTGQLNQTCKIIDQVGIQNGSWSPPPTVSAVSVTPKPQVVKSHARSAQEARAARLRSRRWRRLADAHPS
jgi:hypothetical protein